jgi:hypothetical protein
MGKLTVRKVSAATPDKHEDGDGLRLVVSKTGPKKWVLRVTTQSKRCEMGLGAYPTVNLAEARSKAAEARKAAAGGGDPIAARNVKVQTVPTFTTCAARYIRAHRRGATGQVGRDRPGGRYLDRTRLAHEGKARNIGSPL